MLVNGHDLHVEQCGPEHDPVVVLLHHGLGSVRAWRGQIPVLAQAGFHVVAYDRWGYGGSDSRLSLDLPTFRADVDDLKKILEHLEIERAALVGHSDGGTIALYFAAQYPKLVSCLVTVAAHIYVEQKMELAILGIGREFETDERFRKGLRIAQGEKYAAVFHNWYDGWQHDDFRCWDMRPILSQIRCPSLIVQGEADEHATPQHVKDIAEAIPGAEFWLVKGAGHMLPQENTLEFNSRLLEFLNQYRLVAS